MPFGVLAAVGQAEVALSPGGSVKLEGEDDAAAVADLADEAALGAQVAAVDVVGRKLQQRLQEGLEDAVGDLEDTGVSAPGARPRGVCWVTPILWAAT